MSHYTALSSEKWKVTWAVENKTNFKRQIHMYGWIYFSKVCTDFKKSTYIHRSYCRFAMLNAHHKRKIKTHGCQQFSCLSFSHRSPFTNTHVMLSKFWAVEFHLYSYFSRVLKYLKKIDCMKSFHENEFIHFIHYKR